MADIHNSITVDSKQAVGAFNALNKSVNQANAALTGFKVNADGTIEEVFTGSAKAAKAMGGAAAKAGTEIKGAGKAAQDLALSWQTIARIVQTQVIIRGLSELKEAFFASADAAQEFQLSIGRINAIADQSETSFNDLEERIKTLSQAIGRDLGETSSAVFEALQNDLGTTSETFELLENDATKLAVVTGGTLGDAVNALSSVIKVYGKDSEDAANAAGTLFGAINAGRLTLDELESRLGTVIPLAGRLGVSFEEAASAVATISLAGVDAATSQTQLRNVMNKLIKPTEELQKAFKGLRVDGFEELLKTTDGDFVAALAKIAEELGNDDRAIAKAFNTIRGNLGVFNILAQDGKLAADTLKTVQESALGLNNEFAKINQLDARIAEQNAARLGVIFAEVGEEALKLKNAAAAAFFTIIRDGDDAKAALAALALATGIAAVGFIGFKTQVGQAALALIGFEAAAAPILLGLASFAGGFVLAKLAMDAFTDSQTGLSDQAQFTINSLKEVENALDDVSNANLDKLKAEFDDTSTRLNTVLREAENTAEGITNAFQKTEDDLSGFGANILGTFGDSRERILDNIRNTIKNIDKEITRNTKDLVDAQFELDEIDFKESLKNLTAQDKVAKALARSYQLTAQAAREAAESDLSQGSREAAEQTLKAAESAAKFAESLAKASGTQRDQAAAASQVRSISQTQVNLLERQLTLQQSISKVQTQEVLASLENINEAQKDAIETQLQRYQELTQAVEDGVPKEALKSQFDSVRQGLEEIGKDIPEFSKKLAELGIDTGLADTVAEQLTTALDNLDVKWVNAVKGLKEQLAGESFEAAIKLNAEIDAAAVSQQLQDALAGAQQATTPTEGLKQRKDAVEEFAKTQQRSADEFDKAGAKFNTEITEARALLDKVNQEGFFGRSADNAQALAQPILDKLANINDLTTEELVNLRGALTQALTLVQESGTGIFGALLESTKTDLTEGISSAFDVVQAKLDQTSATNLLGEGAKEDLQNLKDILNTEPAPIPLEVETSGVKEAKRQLDLTDQSAKSASLSTKSIGPSAQSAVGSVSALNSTTGNLASAADNAAAAFERMEQAAKDALAAANAANSAGAGGFARSGGVQYMANGGRGLDTLPTMLQAGEFVASERATRNFLPELQAINSTGTGSDSGGSGDTNITIGDVNVSSNQEVGAQTGRDIALSIKRELRRGTLRL
jgi:hypothetical protein